MSSTNPYAAARRYVRSDRSVVDNRVSRETVRRVFGFARPHRRLIAIFLTFTVIDSAMVVVTPLLVQRIVDDGIIAGDTGLVTTLALAMAGAAVFSAVLAVFAGWFSSRIGEGLIFDLRTQVFAPRPAPVAGLLHPHPDRCAGLAAQQRRDRRPARLHLHAVEHGVQLDRRGRRRHRDDRAQLAGHPAVPGDVPDPVPHLAVGRRPARRPDPPADGRQRRPRQRDDRAVQRRRRHAAQALRPPRRGGRALRRQGGARCATSASGSR